MAVSGTTEADRLADQLERSFQGGAWHGPATREALAQIDAATAARRPSGSPHSIVEIVRHITFWLEAAHQRIGSGRDVDPEGDWPKEGELTDRAWKRALEELDRAYSSLHATVLALDVERLDDPVPGTDPSVRGLVLGILQHNAYHTGQIVQIAREVAS